MARLKRHAYTFLCRASSLKSANLLFAITAGALAAACTPDSAGPARPTVTIGFIDGLPTPTIEVFAQGRPLTAAVLVEPSGRSTPSGPIERDVIYSSGSYGYGPSVGVGVGSSSWNGGRATGVGVGVGVPIGGGYGGPPQQSELRLRARITVPDMAAYRRDWERSIVRVTFGSDPANSEIADIPAPPPGGR